MERQRPADNDLPLATGWTRRREGQAQDFYVLESRLGEGGCGSVFGAKRISDGLPVALKLVNKTESDQYGTPWEVQLMSQVNRNTGHPNILRLYEWFDASEFYVLVLERPEPCRDLSDFCSPQNKLDEQLARGVIQQLLDALLHCQHSGVFHRDVKPANVLINTDTHRVTLIDFGVGTRWTNTPYTSFAGTLAFTPPEWFTSGAYQAGPATVWSLGVTLYNLVCGCFPYNTLEDRDTVGIIWYPKELSPPLVDFMKRCLAPEVELRASLEELRHHPWLRPSCIQSDLPSVLNTLMPDNFQQLVAHIRELSVNTGAQLVGIGKMVLETAICETEFASTYAKMFRELKELTVHCSVSAFPFTFQALMLDLCQREVLKVICDGVVLQKEWWDQRAAKNEDGQKLQELEAKVTAHRKRAVGSMKFLGELHKHGVVKDGVILECITQLLDTETAEAMECLCCLLTTTGSILASEELKPEMDRHFCEIESILRERRLTARVCFMLRDLLELRRKTTSREETGHFSDDSSYHAGLPKRSWGRSDTKQLRPSPANTAAEFRPLGHYPHLSRRCAPGRPSYLLLNSAPVPDRPASLCILGAGSSGEFSDSDTEVIYPHYHPPGTKPGHSLARMRVSSGSLQLDQVEEEDSAAGSPSSSSALRS